MKITLNSPFTLTFTLLVTLVLFLQQYLGFSTNILQLKGEFASGEWQSYAGLLLYPLSHANMQHLVGNFAIILLLGPIIEKKYGWQKLLGLCVATTIIIGVMHILISNQNLIGASGLVFMFIILASLVDTSNKDIPLTFLLVVILFLGQEIVGTFRHDNISQMAHICGGIMGIIYRYVFKL